MPHIAGNHFLTSHALLVAEWSSLLLGETPEIGCWFWERSWAWTQAPLLTSCVSWENYLSGSVFSSIKWEHTHLSEGCFETQSLSNFKHEALSTP